MWPIAEPPLAFILKTLGVVFLMKAKNHLKKGGKIVAIVYDSWLYTKFGDSLKRIFSSDLYLNEILHIKENAFGDALVGATVITLTLDKKENISYCQVKRQGENIIFLEKENFLLEDLENRNFREESVIDFSSKFFKRLSEESKKEITR